MAIGSNTGILDGQGFRIRPDRIEINGDIAWIRDSRTDVVRMKMVREEDGWKVSLVELYLQLDRIMAAAESPLETVRVLVDGVLFVGGSSRGAMTATFAGS